jgi:hypothetical protein
MLPSEDTLCRLFSEHLKSSQEFASWVLNQTKFAGYSSTARLLHEEQVLQRPHVLPERWWRHWHTSKVKTGTGQETDIFLVFEISERKERFSLLIENKRRIKLSPLEAEKFREQAEAYKPRGQFTLGKTEFLGCNDFDTVLIAPHKFRAAHRATCDLFSSYLAYKDIAEFIPEFGSSAQWIEQA